VKGGEARGTRWSLHRRHSRIHPQLTTEARVAAWTLGIARYGKFDRIGRADGKFGGEAKQRRHPLTHRANTGFYGPNDL
jgi:hypothetical protein